MYIKIRERRTFRRWYFSPIPWGQSMQLVLSLIPLCFVSVSFPHPGIMERTSETPHHGWLYPKSLSSWPEVRSILSWIHAREGLLATTELPV